MTPLLTLSFSGVQDPSENRICDVGSLIKLLYSRRAVLILPNNSHRYRLPLSKNLWQTFFQLIWSKRENMKTTCTVAKVFVWSSSPNTTAAPDGQHQFEILWWMTFFEKRNSVYYMMNYNKVGLL